MKEQHELDRLLKNKFDAREFDFQEADWEDAAGLIDAAEASSQRSIALWWRWLFLESAIVLTLAGGLFFSSTQTQSDTQTQTLLETQIQNTDQSLNIDSNSINPSSITANSATTQADLSTKEKDNILQDANSLPAASFRKKSQVRKTYKAGDKDETSGFTTPAQNQVAKTEFSAQEAELVFSSEIGSIDSLAWLSYILDAQGASPDQGLLPASEKAKKVQKHSFALTLGFQSTLGLGGPEEKQLSHWPTIGLRYRYAINSRIHLQSGLLTDSRGGLALNKTFNSTQFGFGRNEAKTTLQPLSTHYLAVPVQLGYRIQKRHRLSIGLQAAYLLNVRSELQKEITDPFGDISQSTEKAWNYRQGFQKVDGGILLGYDFQFRPQMGILLEAYQGLIDVSDDDFWEVVRADKQRQLRLKIYWNLF